MVPALAVLGQPQGTNVVEMLVVRGFATVVWHRDFEERSNYYEALLAAESKAIKGKKKIHSQWRTSDEEGDRVPAVLATTEKASSDRGLHVERTSGQVADPEVDLRDCVLDCLEWGAGRGESYAEKAIAFMRRQILQRDVEVEKSLNDHKDKLPQDVVDGVTTAVGDLKKAVESENVEDIKQKISDARQVSMKIGEALMKNQASGTAGTGFDGGQAAEAEYEDVKGKK
jgi:hypothetical protein